MKLRQLVKELAAIKKELQGKEVLVETPNGLYVPALIFFQYKQGQYSFKKTKETIEAIIIKA